MADTDQACRNLRGPRRSPATSHFTEEETKVGAARPPGHHHTAGVEVGLSDPESMLPGLPSGADPAVDQGSSWPPRAPPSCSPLPAPPYPGGSLIADYSTNLHP